MIKITNIYCTLLLAVGVFSVSSCKKDDAQLVETRLFRPVLSTPLTAINNTIIVKLNPLSTAVGYKIELSKDSFATPALRTVEVSDTTTTVVFDNLLWNKNYQVRGTAYAAKAEFNSRIADFGSVRTERFPSILAIPQSVDIIDIGLNVRWTVTGAPVTTIKIFAAADEELKTALATYTTTASQQAAGLRSVKQLTPATSYTVAIYSDAVLRGFETFKTKPALPTQGIIVDLRGANVPVPDDGSFLFDALTNAVSGSTIILDGDQTYRLKSNFYIDKDITIKSGYSLTSAGAIIDFTLSGQFEIGLNATIGSIVIDGVSFLGTTAKYVFNAGGAVTTNVNNITLVNCNFTSFRNLIRTRSQWTSGSIKQFTVDNCFLSDFSNAGLVAVDAAANNTLPSVAFKNSTFWKVQKLVNNRATTDSKSLIISDCTFSESPKGGQLIEYLATTNLADGLLVSNTIFGRGADNGATPPVYDNPFIKSGNLPATAITFSNTFKTNDFTFTATTAPTNTTYNGSITDLWEDPLNGNFKIKDKTFVGKSSAGALRWRL